MSELDDLEIAHEFSPLPAVNDREKSGLVVFEVGLWCIAFAFIWLNLGKRRTVLMVCVSVLVLAWGPLSLWLAESIIRGHSDGVVDNALHQTGLDDPYATFYGVRGNIAAYKAKDKK